MTDQEKLQHCAGCYDNVYNHGCGGSNRCWMLDNMKLIKRKEVPTHQRPPWTQKARLFPDCYRKSGYVYVKPEQEH